MGVVKSNDAMQIVFTLQPQKLVHMKCSKLMVRRMAQTTDWQSQMKNPIKLMLDGEEIHKAARNTRVFAVTVMLGF